MRQRNHFYILLLVALLAPHLVSAQETPSEPVTQAISTDTQISKPLNRIIAVVNEDVITEKEFTEAIKTATKRLQSQGVQIPDDPKPLHNQVLETIITKRIQLQHAKMKSMRQSIALLMKIK